MAAHSCSVVNMQLCVSFWRTLLLVRSKKSRVWSKNSYMKARS